jgi:signal transduction histidine kinase
MVMGKRKNLQISFKAILYFLFIYVLLQLFWWGTLLSKLNREVETIKYENIVLHQQELQLANDSYQSVQAKIKQRNIMFLGEGLVFVIILCFGIYRLLKVMNAEYNLNKQQHNFLLSVTHELKSPLASAKLQIETLLKLKTDQLTQNKLLNNALIDIERLNLLTDNILTATQLENNNFMMHLENIDIVEFSENIIQKFQLKNSNRKIQLHTNNSRYYKIDKTCFTSILYNLIENSIKYSDPNTEINVFINSSNDELELIVADLGIGISDSDKEMVFKKFYRIGNEQTRKSKGTGLGLFIIKELVEILGGKCLIEDNIPYGTRFIVKL